MQAAPKHLALVLFGRAACLKAECFLKCSGPHGLGDGSCIERSGKSMTKGHSRWLLQKAIRCTPWASQLIHPALSRGLIRAPAQEPGAMTESASCDGVKGDFDNQFRTERLPGCRAFGTPATWSTGGVSSEAGRLNQCLEFGQKSPALFGLKARAEAHVVEQPRRVVQAQKQ